MSQHAVRQLQQPFPHVRRAVVIHQLQVIEAGATCCLSHDAGPALLLAQSRTLLALYRERKAVLDSFSEGYYALDADWRFVEMNSAASRHFQRPVRGLLGRDFWAETGIARTSSVGLRFIEACARLQPVFFETESQLRPGEWFEVHLHPHTGGGLDVYYRDITGRKRVEDELRQSEEKFAKAFRGSTAAMTITRMEDGRYVEVNDRWVEIAGFKREAVIGRTVSELHLWSDPGDRERFVHELRQRGFVANAEYVFVRASGEPWTGLVSSQVTEIGGESMIVSSVIDITERKRTEEALRESERRYATLFGNKINAIAHCRILADPIGTPIDYEILAVNDAHEEITGLRKADVEGRRAREVFPGIERLSFDFIGAYGRVALEGQEAKFDVFFEPLGQWLSIYAYSPTPGEFTAIFTDITAHKTAEAALRQSEARERQRAEELKRAEQALTTVNERLAEADRRKDEFIAVLSHELRNPLAPIRYALPLLHAQQLDEPGGKALSVINRQVDHLTRLVDDLLDVSRITRGKIELRREHVLLGTILRAAVEAANPAILAARHAFTVNEPAEPIWLHADAARLAQVVTNLLNNSAKYTPKNGAILLQAARENGQAVIRVRDNGMGIPADALASVFEMFRQVNRPTRSQGGLGIGLALARLLVEMHGGTIEARSSGTGQGAEFVVTLPVAPATGMREPQPDAAVPAAPRRLRVLVVDDNLDLVEMLAESVSKAGHDVRKALDGPGAIAAALTYLPHVVLLDLGLPVMSGFDVARELRTHPQLAGVRLVALTGWGQAEDRRQTTEAGFDHHLTKPTEPAELHRLLARYAVEGPPS